ncbi:MAG: MFS transporter [bacterium]|nr:MFS transporter [bacterium]
MAKNRFFKVLKINNFLKIWSSQILSMVTVNIINFIIVLRIFEVTHSTVAVSLVWIFYAMPALLVGPFSGTLVDLTDKKKILLFATVLEAFIVLLYLVAKVKVWPIYTIIFLYSLVNQLYIPAEASTLSTVVPKKLFAAANTLFIFTIYGSVLLGFGLAGSLVRMVGRETPFLIAFLLLLMASFVVSLLPKGMRGETEKIDGFPAFWARAKEGYEFIRVHTEILYPLGLLVMSNVIVGVFAVIAPLFASEVLGIELLDIGLIMVLPAGLGAVLGAIWVINSLKRLRKKRIITIGLFLQSFALAFFSLILPNLAFAKIPASIFISFLLGVGLVSLFIPAQTFIQEKTPEKFRGRVFGVLGFLFTLAAVLPILLTATIADIVGITFVIMILAILMGFFAFYSLREPYLNSYEA